MPAAGKPVVGKRFRDALVWAAELHEDQARKGGNIPYVGHLLGVSAIVLEHGGNEDQAIAGLLHDALEDQAHKMTPNEIRARFGDQVELLVEACTDGDPEEQRDRNKDRWYKRKEIYIAAIPAKPPGAIIVSMADKLYNARSILEDYRAIGEPLWSRFTTGREGTLWYYTSLIAGFEAPARALGLDRLWGELSRTVAELKLLVESAG
jgi:(p)ppGpp synthase/HD superfamily hydrolase